MLLILSCFAFDSPFASNVATLLSKSELFVKLTISDLLTNLSFLKND